MGMAKAGSNLYTGIEKFFEGGTSLVKGAGNTASIAADQQTLDGYAAQIQRNQMDQAYNQMLMSCRMT